MKKNFFFAIILLSFSWVHAMKRNTSVPMNKIKRNINLQYSTRIKEDIFFRSEKFPLENLLKIPQKDENFIFTQVKPHDIQDDNIEIDLGDSESSDSYGEERKKNPYRISLKKNKKKNKEDIFCCHENRTDDPTEENSKTPFLPLEFPQKFYFSKQEFHMNLEINYKKNPFDETVNHHYLYEENYLKKNCFNNHGDDSDFLSSIRKNRKRSSSSLGDLYENQDHNSNNALIKFNEDNSNKTNNIFRRLSSCYLGNIKIFTHKKK